MSGHADAHAAHAQEAPEQSQGAQEAQINATDAQESAQKAQEQSQEALDAQASAQKAREILYLQARIRTLMDVPMEVAHNPCTACMGASRDCVRPAGTKQLRCDACAGGHRTCNADFAAPATPTRSLRLKRLADVSQAHDTRRRGAQIMRSAHRSAQQTQELFQAPQQSGWRFAGEEEARARAQEARTRAEAAEQRIASALSQLTLLQMQIPTWRSRMQSAQMIQLSLNAIADNLK